MKQKEKYTLSELYDNLRIPYSELSRMAKVNEGTLTRIRKGYAARRSTINKLLDAFKVQVSERPKPERPSETERYLTPEQQAAALEFWKRHGVDSKMPESEKEFIG